ncbi:MAG: DUF2117 domain-containing protein, partial [Candidatus Methanomethyliaceae archaeon]|nr:DUF2117 domain-containing protein [Candidatus Methanomethyliaceae archaeon]
MRICLRFHMCRIFESNWAEKILSSIKKHGEVIAVVSGTMGAIAMMDVGLDKSVRILKERFVEWINRENFNVIVNATYTTSLDRMLADCWHLSRKINLPIIGIDANSKTIAYWRDIRELAECISNDLNFKLIKGVDFGETFWMDGEKEYRRILAVEPEDWILVNGIVVGKATERDVIFVCKNGEILEIKGASIKYHGLKRLGRIDIKNAKIDTVRLLRDKVENRASLSYLPKNIVAFIDHIGYYILRFLEEG